MSRYRWTILALGTVAQASYSAVFLGIPVLAPELREEYGLTLTEIGVVIAAVSIGSMFTLLPWGLLTDRLGERKVLGTGLAASSVALVIAAFSSSYGVLVAMLVLAGAAGASVNAASGRDDPRTDAVGPAADDDPEGGSRQLHQCEDARGCRGREAAHAVEEEDGECKDADLRDNDQPAADRDPPHAPVAERVDEVSDLRGFFGRGLA